MDSAFLCTVKQHEQHKKAVSWAAAKVGVSLYSAQTGEQMEVKLGEDKLLIKLITLHNVIIHKRNYTQALEYRLGVGLESHRTDTDRDESIWSIEKMLRMVLCSSLIHTRTR